MARYRVMVNRTSYPSAAQVWDSGVVSASSPVAVRYGGAPLASDGDYAWTVVWWDDKGVASPPAKATFSTALLSASDWEPEAAFLGVLGDDDRNQIRGEVTLPPALAGGVVVRARCFVVGLGYHVTHVNGVRLGEAEGEVLGPSVQFDARLPYQCPYLRANRFQLTAGIPFFANRLHRVQRVLAKAYDCAPMLRLGGQPNVVATTLGRGWFAMPVDNHTKVLGYTTLGNRTFMALVTADVRATSGTVQRWRWGTGSAGVTWRHAGGPVVSDHLFLGEVRDGRRETPGWLQAGFDDSAWDVIPPLPAPPEGAGRLEALIIPPIRKVSPVTPVAVREVPTGSGSWVFDLGSNFAGWCRVTVEDASGAGPGDVMRLRHAEAVDAQGALVQNWLLGGASEQSKYAFRADGSREVFEPLFSYFGFRFVEVTGYPGGGPPPLEALECWFSHTNLAQSSAVVFAPPGAWSRPADAAAAATVNGAQGLIVRSALSNYYSHPTDCPSREKRGWTGDGGHAAETLIFNFDMAAPYRKWLQDIADAAIKRGGGNSVPEMAPFLFGPRTDVPTTGNADPAWAAGFIDVLDWVHRHYGDDGLLARHYGVATAYVAYLSKWVDNNTGELLQTSFPGTRYGDWCSPISDTPLTAGQPRHTSNVINGYFWIRQLDALARMARVLGKSGDATSYAARADAARASYVKLYFNESAGCFSDPMHTAVEGTTVLQTENALALSVPGLPLMAAQRASAVKAIVADIQARGGHRVGMVGMKFLLPVLGAGGHVDVAQDIITTTVWPSYGYNLVNGEGSLWERWSGDAHTVEGSRNHIMNGGGGQWLYQGLGGVTLDANASAWDAFSVFPAVGNLASPAQRGMASVELTHATVRGAVVVRAELAALSNGTVCDTVAEGSEAPGSTPHVATIDCGAQTISKILFASYGQPTGNCSGGFAVNPSCDAKSSLSVVEGLCVGKARCVVAANNTQFGGQDPCGGDVKALAIVAQCSGGCRRAYALNVTVPHGSKATVGIPVPTAAGGGPAPTAASAVATEGSATVFSHGKYAPGVPGVIGARFDAGSPGSVPRVVVTVGGGDYAFATQDCSGM